MSRRDNLKAVISLVLFELFVFTVVIGPEPHGIIPQFLSIIAVFGPILYFWCLGSFGAPSSKSDMKIHEVSN